MISLDRRDPVFVDQNDTLRMVAHKMWVEDVGALVVGDPQQPLGIISERDLVLGMAKVIDPDMLTAAEVMTPHLVSVQTSDTLDYAAYKMMEGGIRHLPVLDQDRHVVGMISIRDLLRPFLSSPTRPTPLRAAGKPK